ncbi:uncharacterized protein VTP21DRAFT_2672 [Calcarisporiella thermophila]|uniref:uncharacterized protein n=1 Tax=Calcarisporiella thermophila TaxID=911321 RepID=UPI003743B259
MSYWRNARSLALLRSSSFLYTSPNITHARPSRLATLQTRNTSAFAKFVETLKTQWKKNRELQDNIKQLQDQTGKMSDSDALKKAKEMYEKAKEGADQTSSALGKTAEVFKKQADEFGQKFSETIKEASETKFVKDGAEKISSFAQKVSETAEPIVQSPHVQKVSESVKVVLEDTSSRYGGFVDKETRRKLREEAMKKEGLDPASSAKRRVEEDPNAGQNIVLHKDSAWKESWNKFKENNPVMQGIFNMKRSYDDSDNIFISYTRAFTDRISDAFSSIFEETETAQAIRSLQQIDPRFNLDRFIKEAREYIVPEVLDAYLKGDAQTLREWCSEATYNVLTAGIQAQIQQGLVSDCRILDLRNVELVTAKVLDNDVPVLVLSFQTQEVILFRNRLTREIVYGKEDHIEQVTYACVLTMREEDLQNPTTGGWRVIDMAKHDSRPTW